MIEHIVKNNENIKDILDVYHISLDELKEYNRHITDFSNIICGQKILIPFLKEEVSQILDSTESFVEKYYDDVVSSFDSDNKTDETIKAESNVRVEESNEKSIDEVKAKYGNSCKKNPYLKAYGGITPPKRPYNGNTFKKK